MGGHCSVNGTPTRKPSAQTLPPEIERRDRERQCGSFRASRASRVAPDSGKAPETREKTCPRLLPVEIGQTAWRWGESGANRSRPLDAAIAPRRPLRELAGVRGSPEDRGAILDLASRYCHTFDLGDPDGWAKCFPKEGLFEAPGRTLKGREELRKMAESAQFPAPIRHLPSVFSINGDANSATMLCYFTVIRLDSPPATFAVGRYEDELKKIDGQWKFAARRVIMDWSDT